MGLLRFPRCATHDNFWRQSRQGNKKIKHREYLGKQKRWKIFMKEPIATAIIGFGPHGQRIAQSIKNAENLVLAGVLDRDEAQLRKLEQRRLGYTELNEMYDKAKPQCVVIATNGPSHFALAEDAMDRGVKFVLVSKPLTCRLAEAHALIEKSKQKGVKLAVDHGLRYDPTFSYVQELIEQKTLGELLHVRIMRSGIGLGCLGVHSFDLANSLFQSFPNKVSAWIDEPKLRNPRGGQFVDPGGTVVLSYRNGRRAIVEQVEEAIGSFMTEVNFSNGQLLLNSKTGEIHARRNGANGLEAFPIPTHIKLKHNTIELMQSVLVSLTSDTKIAADAHVGLKSVEILVAAYESHDQGNCPVDLPLRSEAALNRFIPVT